MRSVHYTHASEHFGLPRACVKMCGITQIISLSSVDDALELLQCLILKSHIICLYILFIYNYYYYYCSLQRRLQYLLNKINIFSHLLFTVCSLANNISFFKFYTNTHHMHSPRTMQQTIYRASV